MDCKIMRFITFLHFIFFFLQPVIANITTVKSLYDHVTNGYDKRLLPVLNQSDTTKVTVFSKIISINELDEISRKLSFTTVIALQWVEERMRWNPEDFDNRTSILFNHDEIWRPMLYIQESYDTLQEIGTIPHLVRVFSDGSVLSTTGEVLDVICPITVTFFPFDAQVCHIRFGNYVYTTTELLLETVENVIDTTHYAENSMWKLQNASISSTTIIYSATNVSVIEITLTFQRRSEFFIVYLIVPLALLSILNTLVFVLPESSGERNSVAITTFLSFVVYLDVIASIVPKGSAPIAYIYYFVMVMMIYSSSIMILCVISLRIHAREDPVPPKLKVFVGYITCRCKKSSLDHNSKTVPSRMRSNSKSSDKYVENGEVLHYNERDLNSSDLNEKEQHDPMTEITWKIVGKTFDKLCAILLILLFWPFSIISLIKLYYNVEKF